jgi:HAD superfamily hydrolase (TIGR01450 family)
MAWILDLDGVVWLGDSVVSGSPQAIEELRIRGERVLFLTNNSSSTVSGYLAKMEQMGVRCAAEDLCTSAQAAALLVEPDEVALVCGGEGIVEALTARGVRCVRDPEPSVTVVVAGWHRDFDFSRLTAAFHAVAQGARLVGTNDDPTYPTASGPLPGGGSIVAAIAYASGATPIFAGKPNEAAAKLVFDRLGMGENPSASDRSSLWMVGDRPTTDGEMATTIGGKFGLVLSGVTTAKDLPVTPTPTLVADNLLGLVRQASTS